MTSAGYSKGEDLAREYAQAAYQYTTQDWVGELKRLWDQLVTDPDLLDELADVGLPFSQRQARLDSLLSPDTRPDMKNYLSVLLRDGHLGLLDKVIADMTRLATRGPGAQVAYVISAVPLTREEQQEFRRRIHASYGSLMDLEFQIDASILGGVVIRVGDKVIDGSIAGKLEALHDRLVAIR